MTAAAPSAVRAYDEPRARAFERLASNRFDLLVIGGGIVGAGVAALAAEHGLTVALVERRDFASGTSSASSKLIHGGLRYLRMGDFRLVREALHESNALVASVAPHLVRPLRFLLPIYDGGPYGKAAIRSALMLYRALAGSDARNAFVPADIAAALVPSLRLDHLRAAGVYRDAQANDARLCLANLRAAADRGAAVVNYAEVVAIEGRGGRTTRIVVADRVSDDQFEIDARAVVNATGPWIDSVRKIDDPNAGSSVLLSKGAHLTLELPSGWHAALTIPLDRARVAFAVPWEGTLLLGTTDEPYEGDPDDVEVTPDDEREILRQAASALTSEVVDPARIRGSFAGLRVLPRTGRSTAQTRREVSILRSQGGMVSVAGGKLTTYRRIAASILEALPSELGLRGVVATPRPLPGAVDPGTEMRRLVEERGLDPILASLLASTYGAHADGVLAVTREDPSLLEPLAAGAPEIAAQAVYARDHEWATTPDDVLRRRTTLELRGFRSSQLDDRVAMLLAREESG